MKIRPAAGVLSYAALVLGCALPTLAQEPVNASGGELLPAQAAYDVLHYDLALEVLPEEHALEGTLTVRAKVVEELDALVLDLDDRLEVRATERDGGALEHRHADGRLHIDLGESLAAGSELVVTIRYGGNPRRAPRPPWDGGLTWAKTKSGEPWITTTCQGEGADLWWPCKDHPSDKPDSMDLRITVPGNLFCASNGTLVEDRRLENGKRELHWKIASPISNYNVALNIGPYQELRADFESVAGETVPVYFWVLPESLEKGRAILPEFLDHLRSMEKFCGPYPFRHEKYGIVETPHLGMEHQTVIAYGNRFRKGNPDYDWLHHHELSHEWWGNLVTCRDWKDMWIHEGIGTYMQALYLEERYGKEAYQRAIAGNRRGLNNERPVAPRESRDSKEIYFQFDGSPDNDIYSKGSCIMHTLRWALEDDTFFEVLRKLAYPEERLEKLGPAAVRFSDTEEILAICERVSGRELGWFFEVYLRQPKLPELRVEAREGNLHLAWSTPVAAPFPLPVPVRLGEEIVRVPMPGGRGLVELEGREWEVDPDDWLLRSDSRSD